MGARVAGRRMAFHAGRSDANWMPHPGFARVVADLQTRRLADLPQITAT